MAVYLDDAKNKLWTMKMSHMIADTRSELDAMAHKIDLEERWKQKVGERNEHFDVSQNYANRAIAEGAKRITQRELVKKLQERDLTYYLEH